MGESHRVAFLVIVSSKSATPALPGRDFCTRCIQIEFGLPSVRNLGERILSLKRKVVIRK